MTHLRDSTATAMLKSMDHAGLNLCGQLLIAMPDMGDDRFSRSVVYICAHSKDGAMGLIVNKPAPEIRFKHLLEQLGLETKPNVRDIRVHIGGPVEHGRGFVLHSTDYRSKTGTIDVDGHVCMTATMDVLEEIAKGAGPDSSMLALGYAGWGPGQLEAEIGHNAWLTCEPKDDIIFGRANEHKWTAALRVLGIDPLMLSSASGRA